MTLRIVSGYKTLSREVIFTQPQGCVLVAFTELILLSSKAYGVVRSAPGKLQRLGTEHRAPRQARQLAAHCSAHCFH